MTTANESKLGGARGGHRGPIVLRVAAARVLPLLPVAARGARLVLSMGLAAGCVRARSSSSPLRGGHCPPLAASTSRLEVWLRCSVHVGCGTPLFRRVVGCRRPARVREGHAEARRRVCVCVCVKSLRILRHRESHWYNDAQQRRGARRGAARAGHQVLSSKAWHKAHTSTQKGLLLRLQMLKAAGLPAMRLVPNSKLKALGRIPRSHEGHQVDAIEAVTRCGADVDNWPLAVLLLSLIHI